MKVRRALVTGATGGFGLALTRALLDEGYEVLASGRDAKAGLILTELGARFEAADLLDPVSTRRLVAGIDVVFHAAALSSPWGAKAAFWAVNVEATHRLLEAARTSGCDSFVFISTPSVYAEAKDRLRLTEASPLAATFANAYVSTKHAAELLVRDADTPRFSTMILRPKALVGPDDRVLLPRLTRVARHGWFPIFRGGRALIELTDVRDACAAAIAADRNRRRAGGRIFNISGGVPQTIAETLDLVFSALDLRPRRVALSYHAAKTICRGLEGACACWPGRPEPPATVYSLTALAFSQTFDLALAKRVLDWRPSRTPEAAIAWATAGKAGHHATM